MKKLLHIWPYMAIAAVVCLFLPGKSFAQGGVAAQTFTPWRTVGNALYTAPGAAVTVCSATASVTNGVCFPAENDGNCCFVDATLLVHIPTNPFLVGGDGNVSPFFAAPGTYQVSVAGSGLTAKTYPVTVAGTGAGNVVLSGTNPFTGINTMSSLNGVLYVDGTRYTTIAAAYAALPVGGGCVLVPPNYTETFSGGVLTLGTNKTCIQFLGPAVLTGQIVVPAAVEGVSIITPFPGSVTRALTNAGVQLIYTGTGSAIQVGTTSSATATASFHIIGGMNISISGAGATGLRLNQATDFSIAQTTVLLNGSGETGMVCDGTGGIYCGNGSFYEPKVFQIGAATNNIGIKGTGPAVGSASGMNAVRIWGGHIVLNGGGGGTSVGIDMNAGVNNYVYGPDIESVNTALAVESTSPEAIEAWIRVEDATNNVNFAAGSAGNKLHLPGLNGLVSIDTPGTNSITSPDLNQEHGDVWKIVASPTNWEVVNKATNIPRININNTGPNTQIDAETVGAVQMCSNGGAEFDVFKANTATKNFTVDCGNNGNATVRGSLTVGSGIAQGSGFKHQRFGGVLGGTCPTAAAAGAPCTSGNLTWTAPFADNSYTVVCTLNGSMTGQPHIVSTTYQAAGAGITLTIAADTAVASNVAAAGFVDCTAQHD